MKRIPVLEIMSKNITALEPFVTVQDAAAKMVEMGSGCIIVSDEGNPVGIVTERDIVRKVVSERKNPTETKLEEVMSSPIVWIHKDKDIIEAAKQMAAMKLRRLVVMKDAEVVGMLTVENILHIAPHLIEITSELAAMECEPNGSLITSVGQASGYCESCKAYSDMLEFMDGELICPECKETRE